MRFDCWISGIRNEIWLLNKRNIEWDLTVEYARILNEIWQLNKREHRLRFDCQISGNIEWDLIIECAGI